MPVSSGLALTTTFFSCSVLESALWLAKAGTSVLKFVVGSLFAYLIFSVKVPWIAVPLEVISLTWPALTSLRKKGL